MIAWTWFLRDARFDLGFLLTNSFRSALLFYAGRVRERVGFALDLRRIFLNHAIEPSENILKQPMVEYYMNLLSEFTDLSKHDRIMRLYPSEEDRKEARRVLLENGWDGESRLVGINPFSHQWITKRWLPERFTEVVDRLIKQYKVQCVFISVEKDRPLFEKIKGMCRNPLIDLVGKTSLPITPAVLEKYSLFITNDSGLMHMAAAMGTPIVALFGPTDWRRTAPFTEKATIIRKELDHEPCMRPNCCRAFECMEKITVEEVVSAAAKYLKERELGNYLNY